ncbi:antitoxin [Frankia sp. AgB1.9]|uniref:type II toxin-antitoxin system VapB family antitoxin n=1 Tax=unclassified Frankia TaxID=2632575 RepID=UPI00193170A9|nr:MULTISPECIES: antitoxin [unclassified Frankia]MBL7490123.1 antitoxin [Frankia sp. AgW1.1]MBL7553254.1 antitoxin [Frankia sp. AgB1.9]MBL7625446.1 antitoxin [Frankia sp. AgB1.8]
MADLLIRDVPDGVIAELDAAAARAGVSRVEYLRRTLSAEAERAARETHQPLAPADWALLGELISDLDDTEIMREAWS